MQGIAVKVDGFFYVHAKSSKRVAETTSTIEGLPACFEQELMQAIDEN